MVRVRCERSVVSAGESPAPVKVARGRVALPAWWQGGLSTGVDGSRRASSSELYVCASQLGSQLPAAGISQPVNQNGIATAKSRPEAPMARGVADGAIRLRSPCVERLDWVRAATRRGFAADALNCSGVWYSLVNSAVCTRVARVGNDHDSKNPPEAAMVVRGGCPSPENQ